MTRRRLIALPAAGFVQPAAAPAQPAAARARIAFTLDLEMSRNFPAWDQTHWDYEKGNLDEASKAYAVEAARRVKAAGGRMHCFVVGRVLEHADTRWLEEIAAMGHALGNHTYDHVNVLATSAKDIQFRFQRAPWLMNGRAPSEVIASNIALCAEAMRTRLGAPPNGFRTPGGFADGLAGRPDVQRMLLAAGHRWVSSKYARHPVDRPHGEYLAAALRESRPFRYPESGLLEIPMSPVSDINAFRNGRWPLERYLETLQAAVEWTVANGAVLDILAHPSCLGVVDPKLRAVEMVCALARKSGAKLVGLDEVAAGEAAG